MTAAGSAIVLGGGIAGLAAAIALRDAGYRVAVYEQAPAIEPLGAAISLWPNAVAALRRLRTLTLIEREAAPIASMLLASRAGVPLMGPWSVGPPRHAERAYLPTRALVQKALVAALGDVPMHLGRRAIEVTQHDGCARVTLADGEMIEAGLVIAADGIWSTVGTALTGAAPQPRGYRGVLAMSDPVDGPALNGLAAEYWACSERFGVFDLGADRRYWFYMADDALPMPDHDGLLAKALSDWPASVTSAIAATPADRLIPVTITARAVPRRLGWGRVICVGDAGHAMEPNLGQGACQGLEDAAVLGSLARHLPTSELAAAFDLRRRRRVAGMMRRAQEGGWAVHGSRTRQRLARLALRLTPGSVQRRMIDGFYQLPALEGDTA